jgi:nitrogen-specific signal transduction histidine kinase
MKNKDLLKLFEQMIHDINNPLMVLQGGIKVLKDDIPEVNKNWWFEQMKKSSDKIYNLMI